MCRNLISSKGGVEGGYAAEAQGEGAVSRVGSSVVSRSAGHRIRFMGQVVRCEFGDRSNARVRMETGTQPRLSAEWSS